MAALEYGMNDGLIGILFIKHIELLYRFIVQHATNIIVETLLIHAMYV
jgi:hypothetical protein